MLLCSGRAPGAGRGGWRSGHHPQRPHHEQQRSVRVVVERVGRRPPHSFPPVLHRSHHRDVPARSVERCSQRLQGFGHKPRTPRRGNFRRISASQAGQWDRPVRCCLGRGSMSCAVTGQGRWSVLANRQHCSGPIAPVQRQDLWLCPGDLPRSFEPSRL